MTGNTTGRAVDVFVGREWVVLLRGVTAIVFGVLAFTLPSLTHTRLVTLFGVYAMFHGLISLIGSIGGRGRLGCVLLGTEGIIGIWAGVFTVRASSPSPIASVVLIWLWAVGTGALQIAEAIRLRKEMSGDIWLALSGLVTVFFAWLLWLRSFFGVIGLAMLIAVFALVWGAVELLLGRELRAMRHHRLHGPGYTGAV